MQHAWVDRRNNSGNEKNKKVAGDTLNRGQIAGLLGSIFLITTLE